MSEPESGGLAVIEQPLSAKEIQAQVNIIQEVQNQVMQKDVHYGVIPGTGTKPTLLKPGAEKICMTFRLAAIPNVLDLSTADEIRFRVSVNLVSPSNRLVGSGVGECSTGEAKYKWRSAVCPEEYDEANPDRRQEKWRKGWGNKPPYKQQQIRTEPADLANTVLKMAKKRALVDAVLTATAASDIFTQDIEDLEHPPEDRKPGGVADQAPDPEAGNLIQSLNATAEQGWPALQEAWGKLSTVERAQVGSAFKGLKDRAMAVQDA